MGRERPTGPGRIVLVRNPRFRVWSSAAQPEGYPDRIVIGTGLTQAETVRQVAEGRADAVWEGVSAATATDLQARHPTQVHTVTGIFMEYIFLNTTVPPFNNRDARRAVAYALDRTKLASDAGTGWVQGDVTCQAMPPDFPGYDPYRPYTLPNSERGQWSAPDKLEAHRLVRASGTKGARVVVPTLVNNRSLSQQSVDLLDGLGYRASLHPITNY